MHKVVIPATVFVLILSMMSTSSVSQQSLPDLAIVKVWVGDKNNTPLSPRSGEPFYVCATVKNLGNALGEGYYVQPYFGGSPLAAGGPGKLEAGSSQDWSSGPISVGQGIYEIRWVLNPDRKVVEGNYGNNEISMIVVIEAGSSIDAILQPLGGPVGLGVVVLIIMAVVMVVQKYLQKRKSASAANVNKEGQTAKHT